jgi:hypothetical protein
LSNPPNGSGEAHLSSQPAAAPESFISGAQNQEDQEKDWERKSPLAMELKKQNKKP